MTVESKPIPLTLLGSVSHGSIDQIQYSKISHNSIPEDTSMTSELIDSAREDILSSTKELHRIHAENEALFTSLQSIRNYAPTNYLLYINDDKLDYYIPRFPWGEYTYGDSVADWIENAVHDLNSYYKTLEDVDKWKGLQIARDVSAGTQRMFEDYSKSTTYHKFALRLSDIRDNLTQMIERESSIINQSLDDFIKNPTEFTLFDLYKLPAESYPFDLIDKGLKRQYGQRLQEVVFDTYLSLNRSSPEGKKVITKRELRNALLCVATNVKRLDIEWKYQQITQGKGDIDTLSDDDLQELLDYFRSSPDGRGLLEYFSIPIDQETFSVSESFLSEQPQTCIEEVRQINEMQVLADMESTRYWHVGNAIMMPSELMYNRLNAFVQHPYQPQLFHTDRYLSFLATAATLIAYVEFCKKHYDDIQTKIEPLIALIDSIAAKTDQMYPKAYHERYQAQWLTLMRHLKGVIRDPAMSQIPYYDSLFLHPLQSPEKNTETMKAHRMLRPSEFLARKVAYWHRYYLENAESKTTTYEDLMKLREGSLVKVSDGQELNVYSVDEIVIRDGFVAQILSPFAPKPSIEPNIQIKVLFQGTIANVHSEMRDTTVDGPGYTLWEREGSNLITPAIERAATKFLKRFPNAKFEIEFAGHSLGGADAQNAVSFFFESLLENKHLSNLIFEVNVHTFNSAGIPEESINRFCSTYAKLREKLGKVRHSLVKDDVVERSAQSKIGENLSNRFLDLMEISNLGVYNIVSNHCRYVHSRTYTILPHKLLDIKGEAEVVHRYLHGVSHSWKDLKGHADDMVNRSPIAKIAFNSLYLIGLIYENELTGVNVNSIKGVGELSSDRHVRESICNIWSGLMLEWSGTQILEGTG